MISLIFFLFSSSRIFPQLRTLTFLLLFGFAHIFVFNCSDSSTNKERQVTANDSSEEESSKKSSYSKTIVFFGDSLTAGLGLPSQDYAWPSLVEKKLEEQGIPIKAINAGLSGDTSSGGLSRLDWALRNEIDIFVLDLGANDMMRAVKVPLIKSNLKEIIQRVRVKYPNCKILLIGMRTFPNLGKTYRKQFDEMYPQVAKETKVEFLPFLLEGVAGERKLNQKDGIHPTEVGHEILAETVFPYIRKLL